MMKIGNLFIYICLAAGIAFWTGMSAVTMVIVATALALVVFIASFLLMKQEEKKDAEHTSMEKGEALSYALTGTGNILFAIGIVAMIVVMILKACGVFG